MWKNIFIEAGLLSAVIFGGFYINANILMNKINVTQENILIEKSQENNLLHLSGNWFGPNAVNRHWGNVSGNAVDLNNRTSISGKKHSSSYSRLSGNKA